MNAMWKSLIISLLNFQTFPLCEYYKEQKDSIKLRILRLTLFEIWNSTGYFCHALLANSLI